MKPVSSPLVTPTTVRSSESEDQNSKEMWKTLNKILPKKPKTAAEIENLSATQFNQYFTTIAGSLCGHFTDPSPPRVLAPRVDREFIPQNVSSAFVLLELRKLKSTKATGLDGIPAKLLKDAAQEVAKPIANLINLTFSTGEIPQEWKEAKVTPIFNLEKRMMSIITARSRYFL